MLPNFRFSSWCASLSAGAAALALAASSSAAALADGNTGTIFGWVYAQGTHRPVCPVRVQTHSNREADWHTVTGTGGWYTFLSVLPGPVQIRVGPGLETRTVEVHANLPTQAIFYVRARSRGCGRRP